MGRIVGIDLGTTYSAVAIPEERSEEGFVVIPDCPGFSVITDALERRITPSVIAEDESGEIIAGYPAKSRAGFAPEPIMFAKRFMGEDVTFQLNKQGALRPEDVSAQVLRHLKKMAEERLGEPVEEAVITVPAYFSLRAKQMTEEAGKMAGLQVAQIAQEPVAAALMYCAGDARDPLTIMTYDLGGGTFDIAILEKRDGTISTSSIRAFDGDRFLGGYDFDKVLALWMLDRLNEKRYDLDANDKVTFAKLMVYAEQAKTALSEKDAYEFYERQSGITDRNGKQVVIEMGITRKKFEGMIAKKIDYTIELCRRAMTEKAETPIKPDQIDEIIMVGGSSRIPMIGRRLEEEFGKRPRLVEPDLCVALGAAILAGAKPKAIGCLKLDPIPAETDLPSLTVTGRVMPSEKLDTVDRCAVMLQAADGSYRSSRSVGPDGAFVFQDVALAPDGQTDFVLSAKSPAGAEIASHRFSVKQTAEPAGSLVSGPIGTNVLSKPIGILTVDGLDVIAPERTPLPYERVVSYETADTSGAIHIPIVEENNPLGEILMRDIPPSLAVGSAVELTLTLQENYQIQGRAYVPAIARDVTVVCEIPKRAQKSVPELRRDYEELGEAAQDALASAGTGVRFGGAKAKRLKERLDDCKEMINSRSPEPSAIQDCLDEIESLTREIGAGWRPEPPKAVFDQKTSEAEDLIRQVTKTKPEAAQDGYDRQLAAIRSEAEKAYTDQNGAVWKSSFEKVVKLCDRLDSLITTNNGGGGSGQPDPAMLLLQLGRELADLAKWAKDARRYDRFEKDFQDLAAALQRIDPKAPDAMTQIRDWYLTKFSDLRQRLNAPDTIGRVRRAQLG